MNNTSTQIMAAPPATGPLTPPARRADPLKPIKDVLKPVASLRLTVVLFVLSMFLIFCGTLAQMDDGLFAILSSYFYCFLAWIPWQVFIRFGQVFFWFPKTWHVPGSFPFPGGYVLGGLLLVNLLAAHFVRFRLSWKRSGILLTHSGLVLLLLGELVHAKFAIEGTMTIENGQACNYVEHAEKTELAVIDSSDPKKDEVVVVPGSILQASKLIQNEQLPFDVQVDRYMVNSTEPRELKPGEASEATQGLGLEAVVHEAKPGTGVDVNQKRDAASAYVTFKKKGGGETLGKYLLTVWLSREQTVRVDGKEYQVALRFQREYKPYTLFLEEFRHDVYPGTDTPRNFSSKVRLLDPSQNEDREVLIYMNNPLRHAGATFYQSSYLRGDSGTVLQVVTNPGWLMPYFSCTLVALGMIVHFGIHLLGFLQGLLRGRTLP
jgi:hypothetical protein